MGENTLQHAYYSCSVLLRTYYSLQPALHRADGIYAMDDLCYTPSRLLNSESITPPGYCGFHRRDGE